MLRSLFVGNGIMKFYHIILFLSRTSHCRKDTQV